MPEGDEKDGKEEDKKEVEKDSEEDVEEEENENTSSSDTEDEELVRHEPIERDLKIIDDGRDVCCIDLGNFIERERAKKNRRASSSQYYKRRLKNSCLCLEEICVGTICEVVRLTSETVYHCGQACENCCTFCLQICQIIPVCCFYLYIRYLGCAMCRPLHLFNIVQSIIIIGMLFTFIYSILYLTILDNLIEGLGYSKQSKTGVQGGQETTVRLKDITALPDLADMMRNTWYAEVITLDKVSESIEITTAPDLEDVTQSVRYIDVTSQATIGELWTLLTIKLIKNYETTEQLKEEDFTLGSVSAIISTETTNLPSSTLKKSTILPSSTLKKSTTLEAEDTSIPSSTFKKTTTLEAEDTSAVYIDYTRRRGLIDIPLGTEVYDEEPTLNTRSTSNFFVKQDLKSVTSTNTDTDEEAETTEDFLSKLRKDYGFILPRPEASEAPEQGFVLKALTSDEMITVLYSDIPTVKSTLRYDYDYIMHRSESTESSQNFSLNAIDSMTSLYSQPPSTKLNLRKDYGFIFRESESTESPEQKFVLKALTKETNKSPLYSKPSFTMPFVLGRTTTTSFVHGDTTKPKNDFGFILERPGLTKSSDQELAALTDFMTDKIIPSVYSDIPTKASSVQDDTFTNERGFTMMQRPELTESSDQELAALKDFMTEKIIPSAYSDIPIKASSVQEDTLTNERGFTMMQRPELTESSDQELAALKDFMTDKIIPSAYSDIPIKASSVQEDTLTNERGFTMMQRPELTESSDQELAALKGFMTDKIIPSAYSDTPTTASSVYYDTFTNERGFTMMHVLHSPELTESSDQELAALKGFTKDKIIPSAYSDTPITVPSVLDNKFTTERSFTVTHRSEVTKSLDPGLELKAFTIDTIIPSIFSETPGPTPVWHTNTIKTAKDYGFILTRPEPSTSQEQAFVLKAFTEDTVIPSYFSDTTAMPFVSGDVTTKKPVSHAIPSKIPFTADYEITTHDAHHGTTTKAYDFGRTILDFGYIVQKPETTEKPENYKGFLLKALKDTIFPTYYSEISSAVPFVYGDTFTTHVTRAKVTDIKNLLARIKEMVKNTKGTSSETIVPEKLNSISKNNEHNLLFDRTSPLFLRTPQKPRTFFEPGTVGKKVVLDKLKPLRGYETTSMFSPQPAKTAMFRTVVSETPSTTETASMFETIGTQTTTSETTGSPTNAPGASTGNPHSREELPWTFAPGEKLGLELGFRK